MKITIKRFDKSLPLPGYEREGTVCFDLLCRKDITIEPKTVKPIPLNVAIQVPIGKAMLIFARSGTPQRKGLMLANGVGVLDPYFSGDKDELVALFYNFTDKPVHLKKGESEVQGMFINVEQATWNEVAHMDVQGEGYWSVRE